MESYLDILGQLLLHPDNSTLRQKGLTVLQVDGLPPALGLILGQSIPKVLQHVVMSSPETTEGKLMFNLCRHVLELQQFDTAVKIDLERLQIGSQLICAVLSILFSTIPLIVLITLTLDGKVGTMLPRPPTPRRGSAVVPSPRESALVASEQGSWPAIGFGPTQLCSTF